MINEPARLAALSRLDLLDTASEPGFDRIAEVARRVFDVPIALVSLLDADRQWFKARCGLDVASTPRDQAFCNHTILHDSVFVVPDAAADRRFSSNPLVTGAPHIRAYAGAPLTTAPDVRIGSLCLIDTRPRDFAPDEMVRLAGLARVVVGEIWLRALERGGQADVPLSPGAEFDFDIEPALSGRQIRAARGLRDWSIADLASAASISPATIKRIEAQDGRPRARPAIAAAIRAAFEQEGVSFTGGDGVRRRDPAAS